MEIPLSFESPPIDLRTVFPHLLTLLGLLNRTDQTPTSLFVAHPHARLEVVFHNQHVSIGRLDQQDHWILVGRFGQFQLL